MKDKLLDAEDESILEAFEADELQSRLDEDRKIQLQAAAEQTFKEATDD